MKHILLFGAGKSATVLIEYLKTISVEMEWKVTVAEADLSLAKSKVGEHLFVKPVYLDVEDEGQRDNLVKQADVVISLLPPGLHYLIALSCLEYGKHLLTASYLDEKIKALANQVAEKNILFLCEMGLDPGLDHMSALELIDRIHALGAKITSFKSHCGGLIAPESDDNPWHYKLSWNPRNVVLAGKSGAVYKEEDKIIEVPYEQLFGSDRFVEVPGQVLWAWYPNRDSLGYIQLYRLHDAKTFIRTTLRHPDFCFGWKNMVDLQLTSEVVEYDTDGMTISDFFKLHFERHGFSDWLTQMLTTRLSYAQDLMDDLMSLIEAEDVLKESEEAPLMIVNENGELDTIEVEDMKDKAATAVAVKMHEANLSLRQLFYLGLDSNEIIDKGKCSAADVLQFVLEKKLALEKDDKDMVIMVHEVEFELDGQTNKIASSLVVVGKDNLHTAMAKTVGLPLGVAARLLLTGYLNAKGLQIPTLPEIYIPVLEELKKYGICFEERVE